MNLEELIEAQLAGKPSTIPPDLSRDHPAALAGHRALLEALADTESWSNDAATVTTPQPQHWPDDFEVHRELGRGGMGVVYLATQKSLGRHVALKMLRSSETSLSSSMQRFLGEAKHLARLRHPHIVSIHQIGKIEEFPYFTMDYIEGQTLSELLKQGPMAPTHAAHLLRQIASAVRHAHEQGIIHRDLKPSNVLIDRQGQAFVSDFGLARDLRKDSSLTNTGAVLGTPRYMAPEQARGDGSPVGEAADIHALGVLLYEMLTGQTPFGDGTPIKIVMKLLHEDPKPPRRWRKEIPRDLETICLKALQKEPTRRYETVSAMIDDLNRFQEGQPVRARRPSLAEMSWRWLRRSWPRLAVIGMVALIAFFSAFFYFRTDSTTQLVSLADKEIKAQHYHTALRLYRQALNQTSDNEERERIISKMVACCQEIQDPNEAVAAALALMDVAADRSLGHLDALLVQALVTRLKAQPGGLSTRVQGHPTAEWELTRKRLKLLLDSALATEAQKAEAREVLAIMGQSLQSHDHPFIQDERMFQLPKGDRTSLATRLQQPGLDAWEEGKIHLAMARSWESDQDTEQAKKAYRLAFLALKSVYPYVSGLDEEEKRPMPERVLVQSAYDAWQRLDPNAEKVKQVELRLKLEGMRIPAELHLSLGLELTEAQARIHQANRSRDFHCQVPVNVQGEAVVKVWAGSYTVRIGNTRRTAEGELGRWANLVELDFSKLPKAVVLTEDPVELPAISIWQAEEMHILEPASGSAIDLKTSMFRWSRVPHASSYSLRFFIVETKLVHTKNWFTEARSQTPYLCVGDLPEPIKNRFKANAKHGATLGVTVEAFDDTGKRIGKALDERLFVVSRTLND